jgi:predicted lactoylglutathione lyase
MIEHVSVPVTNFAKAKEFYVATLKPLGYKLTADYSPEAAGFKESGHTSFWIVKKKGKITTTHLAFRAKNRKAVQDFHKAALKAGGKDNGKPGLRKDYSPDYYASFVLDPAGNNIEAVVFK